METGALRVFAGALLPHAGAHRPGLAASVPWGTIRTATPGPFAGLLRVAAAAGHGDDG